MLYDAIYRMRTWITALPRLVVLMLIVLTSAAVMLGRGHSRPALPHRVEPPRYQPISGHLLPGAVHLKPSIRHHALDLGTGEVIRLSLPQSDYITQAAVSPWSDDQGRVHVVGKWRDVSGLEEGTSHRAIGLARYTVPDGEVLERVELDFLTQGTPCWAPDGTPRVVIAGVQGQLYSVEFQRPGDGAGAGEAPHRPQALDWRVEKPRSADVRLAEPTWPIDSRLGGTLIASLSVRQTIGGKTVSSPWRLWWLRLGPGGATIDAAGRLIGPGSTDAPGSGVFEERLASVSATADGGLALAYLAREDSRPSLSLRIAPLTIDAETGTPRVRESDSVVVASDRAPAAPAFSTDGRWVYSLPLASTVPPQMERSSVDDALALRPAQYAMSTPSADASLH